MTLLYGSVSILQFFAIAYLLLVAMENYRAYTLARNSDWLLKNSDFLQKYRKPSALLIQLSYGVVLAFFLFFLRNSLESAWVIKNSGILIALFGLTLIQNFNEKRLEKLIPEPAVRVAELQRRTIDMYVSKPVARVAVVVSVITALFVVVSFAIGKISAAEFTFDLLLGGLVLGICWGTIIHVIQKKEPHTKELEHFSSESIIANYRTFSVKLMIGALFVFSLFLILFTVVQWSDKVLFITPLYLKVFSWFGAAAPEALISKYLWDVIISFLSALLFIYMGKHRSLQSYRSSLLFQ